MAQSVVESILKEVATGTCRIDSPNGQLLLALSVPIFAFIVLAARWIVTATRGRQAVGCGNKRPKNVGILAAEVYFPSTYVRQTELEIAHGVSKGKFTGGLGQKGLAFVGDREDINSISLTVVENLLNKYKIPRDKIGRLEVGTETLVDRAKSSKTVLMSLFEASGNTDIEGTTVVNACYGGTAALLNALAWIESSGWDGRYAIVVAADIAIYADGPARPTGGCGAVALLVGADAPLPIDSRLKATHASNTWDFFKPKFISEYPEVDGKASQECYLRALEDCYLRFATKHENFSGRPFNSDTYDYFVFHSPYTKLVQKAFARLNFMDYRRDKKLAARAGVSNKLKPWLDVPLGETYGDRELDLTLREITTKRFNECVDPSCSVSREVGNTYTASVYMNLICLIHSEGAKLEGKKIMVYSYGSGALATMFEFRVRKPQFQKKFTIEKIASVVDLSNRLSERETVTPEELEAAIKIREKNLGRCGYIPQYSVSSLFPGTFYLDEVRGDYSRVYARKPLNAPRMKGLFYPVHGTSVLMVERVIHRESSNKLDRSYISPKVRTVDWEGPSSMRTDRSTNTQFSFPRVDDHPNNPFSPKPEFASQAIFPTPKSTTTATPSRKKSFGTLHQPLEQTLQRLLATAAPDVPSRAPVVITGISAGLPGRNRPVFGEDNLKRLVRGESFISPVGSPVKRGMIEKNVVQLKKNTDGSVRKMSVDSMDSVIKLAAQLGEFDLTKYGVSKALVSTMDTVVQVAIAAGLEALKDSGLVTGDGSPGSWQLPENLRDTTGVVYATSFPALESAVSEVMKFLHSQQRSAAETENVVSLLKSQLETACGGAENVSAEDREAIRKLEVAFANPDNVKQPANVPYEFDRKFLFRILVLGNAQLAQIIGARGPNMQTNAACAGTTQAIAIAQDIIQQGRCERLIVIASDNASGDTLMPWLGSGFRALGASSIASTVEEAALPFDSRRNGMILGAGAIGIVLETEGSVARRFAEKMGLTAPLQNKDVQALQAALRIRLLDTQYSNSAYHGASLDKKHIAQELERFVVGIERKYGITREQIAKNGVYLSHETMTHASPGSSCAANEINALRECFGSTLMAELVVLNTKGYTGHPMGVSFEDVAAVEILRTGIIPPLANINEPTLDPYLGNIKVSKGGEYNAKYALRFAAGFGSQVAFALYGIQAGDDPMFYGGALGL